jgi:pectate lyase
LIGSSDSDDKNTNITFHHNWYKNIEQRTPLIRHALVHMYNNYWSNERIDYMFHAINSRMNAKVLVESNYFYNVNNPLIASDDSSLPGCWQTNNENTLLPSIYYSRTLGNGALVVPQVVDGQLQSTCSVNVPYSAQLDPSFLVPAIVMANAGVGKIPEYEGGATACDGSTSCTHSSVTHSSASSNTSTSAAPTSSTPSSASTAASSSQPAGANVQISEAFSLDKATLFSAAYQSISTDATAPRYFITSGASAVSVANNELTLAGGRLTIGHRPPRTATTASDTSANGDFDLSRPYRISFRVVAASGAGKLQVFVDNNTTSSGSSLQGTSSRVFDAAANTLLVGQVIQITPTIGTATSFIALRTESAATVTIDDLLVEYIDGSGVGSSQAVASQASSSQNAVSQSSAVAASQTGNSSLSAVSDASASSVSSHPQSPNSGASSSSAPTVPANPSLSADCITLSTNPNVNWRDTALQTDQEIVECLQQSLGRPVGYGEKALGGYDPGGNSKLTIIRKNTGTSVEQQLLDAITGEAHNWIVFDKIEFAQPAEIGMYRLGCNNPTVQSILGATEAECVNYQQWCANNNVNEAACVSTFFNTAMNKSNNPIRNPVIGSNKTIDGRMSEAYFLFSGFAIGRDSAGTPTQTATSVILTHLSFKGAGHTEDHYVDPDMIRSTGASHDIWIHKNSFDTTGDSAFDVKVGAYNITMSFNRLVNVKRAVLHGSSDSHIIDTQIATTMHHNAFVTTDDSYMLLGNTLRRVPLLRHGKTHMFNNLFVNYRNQILSLRVGASAALEDNVFTTNLSLKEKTSTDAALTEILANLIRDDAISGGNLRNDRNFFWFGSGACVLDETTKRPLTKTIGTVTDLSQNYTAASLNQLNSWRFAAGQDLVDYVSLTAGKHGDQPFNSPLSPDRVYMEALSPVNCQ